MSLAFSLSLAHQKLEEKDKAIDNSLIRKPLYEDQFCIITDRFLSSFPFFFFYSLILSLSHTHIYI